MALLGAVDISSIIGEPEKKERKARKAKTSYSELLIPLQIAVDFLFSIPVYFGLGSHWELDKDENNDLCICIGDVLDAFPSRSSKAFLRAIEKWMPILSLAITAWTISKPRIAETRRLLAEKKNNGGEIGQREESRTEPLVM